MVEVQARQVRALRAGVGAEAALASGALQDTGNARLQVGARESLIRRLAAPKASGARATGSTAAREAIAGGQSGSKAP
jgi:hypothetical protein